MSTRSPAAIAIAVAVLGGAAIATGCSGEQRAPDSAGMVTAGWTTYHDDANRLQVQFPSDWRRARSSLTPDLTDPREILSVGSAPLARSPRGPCAHMPVGALEALGPDDAFVSLQERRSGGDGYPARPRQFRLTPSERAVAIGCLTDRTAIDTWWMAFHDGARRFYALVAIGRDAPVARLAEARRVLDSLRFDARASPEDG